MVCAGVLKGFILFSLFFSGVWGVEEKILDQNTLAQAIKFLLRYQPGSNAQYAIAFNVPADSCVDQFNNTFLLEYCAETVKDALNSAERLYTGKQLIAARPKPIPTKDKSNQHSEYLLLNLPTVNTSHMKNLLNQDNEGCVVFYTYNSPCTNTCINRNSTYNIIQAVDMFKNHNGPKAFVFSRVFWAEQKRKPKLEAALKEVAEKIPLYKCTTQFCVECLQNNNIVCLT